VVPLVGAAVAVGLAGVGVWSGLDTNKAHDAYAKNPTHEGFTAGESRQLRTNILFGSAIAVGAATAVVAIWWTRWSGGEAPTVAVTPSSDGALVTYGRRF
jgi:F0F1-type ATP synthase membrane subunit c/vacuolar-type H+-ATPase subunit K